MKAYTILLTFLVLLNSCTDENDDYSYGGTKLKIETLTIPHRWELSKTKEVKTIRNQVDYYDLGLDGELDFQQGQVLLVNMGEKTDDGDSIKSVKVFDINSSTVVAYIKYQTPGKGCKVGEVITHPFKLIWIPSRKNVLVSEKTVKKEC